MATTDNVVNVVDLARNTTTEPVVEEEVVGAAPTTDKTETTTAQKLPNMLQEATRLSQSIIWDIQRRFYETQGSNAWSDCIVPSFITTNCHMAASYAKTIINFLLDLGRDQHVQDTFHIVELGSGHGKFSFLLLTKLTELATGLQLPKFKYIVTDMATKNIEHCKSHPKLKHFVDNGVLDFALFDAERDTQIKTIGGLVLEADGSAKNIALIANYVFDTLRHDAFQVNHGVLYEGTLRVLSEKVESDPTHPDILNRWHHHWVYQRINGEDYYENKSFNEVLLNYGDHFEKGTVLIPLGAFHSISTLHSFCGRNGHLLLLSGDKGYNHVSQFDSLEDPRIAVHGSFSLEVNYHAVLLLAKVLGGEGWLNSRSASLKMGAFVIGPKASYPLTKMSFESNIEEFGPADFFSLYDCTKEEPEDLSLEHALTFLKLSGYDPDVFLKYRNSFVNLVPNSALSYRVDTLAALDNVWKYFYHLESIKDVPFEIGRVYYNSGEYKRALEFYNKSHELFGPHHVTYYNIGMSHYAMGDYETAKGLFEESLKLDHTYGHSKHWLEVTNNEIEKAKKAKA